MPGICGIISRQLSHEHVTEVDAMTLAMSHEPFHRRDKLVRTDAGFVLGWSCVQDSFADCLPIWNEKKTCLMAFAGRAYFDKEEVTALKSRKHSIGRHNASVLIHAYEEKGADFVKTLNGVYCGLIFDFEKKSGFIFTDRFGLEQLYYHETADSFYFASEAKALAAAIPALRRPSFKRIGELISQGCVSDDQCLFEALSAIPPRARWSFEEGQICRRFSYFNPTEWEEQTFLGEDYLGFRVQELLQRIIPRYSKVEHLASFELSGDVGDLLVACNAEFRQNAISCYTLAFEPGDTSAATSRDVAKIVNQPYQVLGLDSGFFESFGAYAERAIYISDGLSTVTDASALYFYRRVRDIAPVTLLGRYFAEVFQCRRRDRRPSTSSGVFESEFKVVADEQKDSMASAIHPLRNSVFVELPRIHRAQFRIMQSQADACAPFLDCDLLQLLFRAPEAAIGRKRLALDVLKSDDRPLSKALAGTVQEPSFWSRLFARNSGERIREHRGLLGIYRRELAQYVTEVLLDSKTLNRPYIVRERVEPMVTQHFKGLRDNSCDISLLLSLELAHRTLFDVASTASPSENAPTRLDSGSCKSEQPLRL